VTASILCIDDEPAVAISLEHTLAAVGYRISSSPTIGCEASPGSICWRGSSRRGTGFRSS
jgi:hypothetical protein